VRQKRPPLRPVAPKAKSHRIFGDRIFVIPLASFLVRSFRQDFFFLRGITTHGNTRFFYNDTFKSKYVYLRDITVIRTPLWLN